MMIFNDIMEMTWQPHMAASAAAAAAAAATAAAAACLLATLEGELCLEPLLTQVVRLRRPHVRERLAQLRVQQSDLGTPL